MITTCNICNPSNGTKNTLNNFSNKEKFKYFYKENLKKYSKFNEQEENKKSCLFNNSNTQSKENEKTKTQK